jgi:uncharacterized protein with von Willebrand factor type A (vWA) domain
MNNTRDWLVWALFTRLRRYKFPLGPDDYEALRLALQAGFGWDSLTDLRMLCSSLWAKSLQEQDVVFALFDQIIEQLDIDYSWVLGDISNHPNQLQNHEKESVENLGEQLENKESLDKPPLVLENKQGLPPIYIDRENVPRKPLVFLPQFPVSYREVAQAFRRLRKPVRKGPKVVLDVNATIEMRSRRGAISPVIMTPHRVNLFQLVLLVDRYGSMLPFHSFIDQVVLSITQSAGLASVTTYYFHDTPVVGGNYGVLKPFVGELMPSLDNILSEIQPSHNGQIHKKDNLLDPIELHDVLKNLTTGTAVIIISDAGAARRNYDPARLLDTISFLKAMRDYTHDYVWLNPLGKRYWKNSTAEQISRHLPMFQLDVSGMYQAVNTLRGQLHFVEKPL